MTNFACYLLFKLFKLYKLFKARRMDSVVFHRIKRQKRNAKSCQHKLICRKGIIHIGWMPLGRIKMDLLGLCPAANRNFEYRQIYMQMVK
jgi:hypothetical protein